MKTKISAFLLCLTGLYSNPVDLSTAQKVAFNYIKQEIGAKGTVANDDLILANKILTGNTQPLYFFNLKEKNGFIIVAGSDKVKPVLGFSNTGSIPTDSLMWNPGFRLLMKLFTDQIHFAEQQSFFPSKEVDYQWERLLTGQPYLSIGDEVKLKLTTQWGQEGYYNDKCPMTGENGHPCNDGIFGFFCDQVPTGCGATAMGQILKYYKYPPNGLLINQYNDKDNSVTNIPSDACTDPSYGQQPTTSSNSTYNWSNMPDKLSNGNEDVANLLYNCGVAQKMNYSFCESGSIPENIIAAYPTYFDFTSIAKIIYKNTSQNYESTLINEIDQERPVQYAGYGSGGHTWVLMGYKVQSTGNSFWMNWGWDGTEDGWFPLTALNPDPDPCLFTPCPHDYNSDQLAMVNLSPKHQPDLLVQNIQLSSETVSSGNSFNVVFQVKNNGDYVADTCTAEVYLSTTTTINANSVDLGRQSIPSLAIGEITPSITKTLLIPANTPVGAYYIVVFADRHHNVHEKNELNNTNSKSISILTIKVSFPNGGEVLQLSNNATIAWTESGTQNENVKIDLYKNGAFSKTIASSVSSKPGVNTYNWPVQLVSENTQAVDYKIKITALTAPLNSDLSDDNFIVNKGGNSIVFGGITWDISNAQKTPAPGYNYKFDGYLNGSNVYSMVSKDSQGNLHIKIQKIGNSWYCPELTSRYHYGYGEYRYYVNSNLNFDQNVVAGLFNYENDTREIDLEFHHWVEQPQCSAFEGNYIIQQPTKLCANLTPSPEQVNWYNFETPSDPLTTHKYTWSNGSVHFQSYKGNTPTLENQQNAIAEWTSTCHGYWVPEPGASFVVMNLWMMAPKPSDNSTTVELIIKAVKVPQPDLVITTGTASPTFVPPGAPVTINFTTQNKGDGNAGPSKTKLYYSADNIWTNADTKLDSVTETTLSAGLNAAHTITCTIPANAATGTRYIIVYADQSNQVPEESIETNNWTAIPVTIGTTYSTLTVNVHNVPGGTTSLPGAHASVQLLKPNGTTYLTAQTNENGVAVFTHVASGTLYSIKVNHTPMNPTTIFSTEYWGDRAGITIFSDLTIDFTRNQPYEKSEIRVYDKNGNDVTNTTVPTNSVLTIKTIIQNPNSLAKTVKSRIVFDQDITSPYAFDQESAAKTVAGNGFLEFSFLFCPTVSGSYYAVPGTKTGLTSSSYTVTDGWVWPANPTIIVSTPSSPLTVNVHNVSGGLPGIPGNYGMVNLYNSTGLLVASQNTISGTAFFPSVPNASGYSIKVFNKPVSTLFGQEYWGTNTGITISASTVIDFIRYLPCQFVSIEAYNGTTNVTHGHVNPGTLLTFKVTINNPGTASQTVKPRIVIDQNTITPYTFDQEAIPLLIPGGANKTFSFSFTPTLTGNYYTTSATKTSISGSYLLTDGWEWPSDPIIQVTGASSTLSVNVKNIDGTSLPIPSSHGYVELYNNSGTLVSGQATNLNGTAIFSNVTNGTGYSLKVYHDPTNPTTIFGREYWGGLNGITISSDLTLSFKRDMPYVFNGIHVYDDQDNEVTYSTVPEGYYTIKTTVQNPNTQPQAVKVRFVADHSKYAPYDFDITSGNITIPSNQFASFSIPVRFTVENQGGFYILPGTTTTVSNNATITDGWAWYTTPLVVVDPGCHTSTLFPGSLQSLTSTWQNITYPGAGRYSKFFVNKGYSYSWSLCPEDGASAPNYDPELTLRKADDDTILVYNDANCNTGNNPKINWTATFTGTVRLDVTQWRCMGNGISTILKYKRTSKSDADGNAPQDDQLYILYPNPTTGRITIDFRDFEITRVTYFILNMQGVRVSEMEKKNKNQKDEIDLSFLPNGMYFLTITSDDHTQQSKIVIQK